MITSSTLPAQSAWHTFVLVVACTVTGTRPKGQSQDTAIDEVGNLLRPQHLQLDE